MSVVEEQHGDVGLLVSDVDDFSLHPRDYEGVFVETEIIRSAVEIAGAYVPYTLEIPEDIDDPVPLIIINGFGGKKFGYDGLRAAVAQNKKACINLKPPRGQGVMASLNPMHLIPPEKLQSQAVWGVMRDVQKHHRNSPTITTTSFDLAGHSMGGFIGTALAKHKPDAVKTITYVQSVGLEDHSLSKFRTRALEFFKEELLPAIGNDSMGLEKGRWHAVKSEIDYLFHNLPRTIAEAVAVANCDIREDVKYLNRAHGIKTAVLVGTNDTLLPAEETIRCSWGLFEHSAILEGGHLLPMKQPGKVAAAIVDLVHRMDNSPSTALSYLP